jgi:hypothetical protein
MRLTHLWSHPLIRHLVIVGCVLFAPLTLWYARIHTAWRVPTAKVSYNGLPVSTASVFQTREGTLIVRLSETGKYRTTYVLRRKEREVALMHTNSVQEMGRVALHRDAHPSGVLLGTGKLDVEPNIVTGDHLFEFTTAITYARVRIHW